MTQERARVLAWLGCLLGHLKPFPLWGNLLGRDRNPNEALAQADVGSWGRHASRGSQNTAESAVKIVRYHGWDGRSDNPLATLDAVAFVLSLPKASRD